MCQALLNVGNVMMNKTLSTGEMELYKSLVKSETAKHSVPQEHLTHSGLGPACSDL